MRNVSRFFRVLTVSLALSLVPVESHAAAAAIISMVKDVYDEVKETLIMLENMYQNTATASRMKDYLETLKKAHEKAQTMSKTIDITTNVIDSYEMLDRDIQLLRMSVSEARNLASNLDYSNLGSASRSTYNLMEYYPIYMQEGSAIVDDISKTARDLISLTKKDVNIDEMLKITDRIRDTLRMGHRSLLEMVCDLESRIIDAKVAGSGNVQRAGQKTVLDAAFMPDVNVDNPLNRKVQELIELKRPGTETVTLESLEGKVRDSTLRYNVFTLVQLILVGMAMIFLVFAFARRNRGEKPSEDAIIKVLLWIFVTFMILSILNVAFK